MNYSCGFNRCSVLRFRDIFNVIEIMLDLWEIHLPKRISMGDYCVDFLVIGQWLFGVVVVYKK